MVDPVSAVDVAATAAAAAVPLSAATHAAIGAASGMVEVTLLHPTVSLKNALQERRPLQWRPQALYRGYTLNAASFVPITCVQFGVNRSLEVALSSTGDGQDLSALQRVGVAAMAGVASSLVSTPCELVIIQQQRSCGPLLGTAAGLIRDHGWRVLLRGGLPCLLRESTYTAGYLGTAPLVTSALVQHPLLADKPSTALMLGAMLSGVAAAVVSQPLDTVKTRMQGNVGDATGPYASMTRGLRAMWAEGGTRTWWAGVLPRGGRIVMATVILSQTKEWATHHLQKREEAGRQTSV